MKKNYIIIIIILIILHYYKKKYHEYEEWDLDLDIFSGRRVIVRVKLWKDGDKKWTDWDEDFGLFTRHPKTTILPCGYKVIPFYFLGVENEMLLLMIDYYVKKLYYILLFHQSFYSIYYN